MPQPYVCSGCKEAFCDEDFRRCCVCEEKYCDACADDMVQFPEKCDGDCVSMIGDDDSEEEEDEEEEDTENKCTCCEPIQGVREHSSCCSDGTHKVCDQCITKNYVDDAELLEYVITRHYAGDRNVLNREFKRRKVD